MDTVRWLLRVKIVQTYGDLGTDEQTPSLGECRRLFVTGRNQEFFSRLDLPFP
jgi:hypothetical protein